MTYRVRKPLTRLVLRLRSAHATLSLKGRGEEGMREFICYIFSSLHALPLRMALRSLSDSGAASMNILPAMFG